MALACDPAKSFDFFILDSLALYLYVLGLDNYSLCPNISVIVLVPFMFGFIMLPCPLISIFSSSTAILSPDIYSMPKLVTAFILNLLPPAPSSSSPTSTIAPSLYIFYSGLYPTYCGFVRLSLLFATLMAFSVSYPSSLGLVYSYLTLMTRPWFYA